MVLKQITDRMSKFSVTVEFADEEKIRVLNQPSKFFDMLLKTFQKKANEFESHLHKPAVDCEGRLKYVYD